MNKQKYTDKIINNIVLKAYPNSEILKIIKSNNYHSNTFHLTILDNDSKEQKDILLKKYHTKPLSHTSDEYANQSLFYSLNGESEFTTPRPILIDEGTNTILMEYINGISFKYMLLNNLDHQQIITIMKNCANLLYSYHNTFTLDDDASFNIDCPYMDRISNEEALSINEALRNINLKIIIRPFLDYTPWNILSSNEKIYLIDFPEINCVCTPHIDIARFILSIKIIKYTPNLFNLKLKQNWVINDVCNLFIKQYLKRQEIEFNNYDFNLVRLFYNKYSIYLLKKLYGSPNPIEKLQYYYLKNIIVGNKYE